KSKLAKHLVKRLQLWDSRGISIDEEFEKKARLWLSKSQSLNLIAENLQKSVNVIKDKNQNIYKGKVIAKGVLDQEGIPHLILDTNKSLEAFPMDQKQLSTYKI